ncbi:MAG: CDGSH iron-sulfur domain-containing protein [Cycloclasticus sp.]|nr:CDGSH iron-sulfur domain-containing protein [Cycloclasticus sp.]
MYSQQSPYCVDVKKDDEVYICQCGKTSKEPLCDGSHKQTDGIRPLIYKAQKDESLFVCGCGNSANMPWCDGSHKK